MVHKQIYNISVVLKFHGEDQLGKIMSRKIPEDAIMEKGWETLLWGVKSRDKPTIRKQDALVQMNTVANMKGTWVPLPFKSCLW